MSALTVVAQVGVGPAAGADHVLRLAEATQITPGVAHRTFALPAAYGTVTGHLVTADLTDPRVHTDLLYPGAVAARAQVSRMATEHGAVAAVNGDFFNITESQHPGIEATGAAVGPQLASGRPLKGAEPDGQRFGPAPPPSTSTADVLGVGVDHRARLDRLNLIGAVRSAYGTLPLRGLNQYALPVGGIGAFTTAWGTTSRARSTCGTDTHRAAPCSTDTHEVTVTHGRVVATADQPGHGPITPGTTVLVGREAGAQQLRQLHLGQRLHVAHRLAGRSTVPYVFAIGGFPVLRDGKPLDGLDTRVAATRSAAGIGDRGRHLYLLSLDGTVETGAGLTLAELAALMRDLGADAALNLDGGGSSTLAVRAPGAHTVTVRNHPPGTLERPVPNAIGVFSRSAPTTRLRAGR